MKRSRRAAQASSRTTRHAGPVPATELRWRCDEAPLARALAREAKEAAAASEDEPTAATRRAARIAVGTDEVVGQERALAALRTGLARTGPGFHVYVCGDAGSGREALVRAAVAEAVSAGRLPPSEPRDLLYLANFEQPEKPRLLALPRGQGRRFRRDVDGLIGSLRRALAAVFEDPRLRERREAIERRAARAGRRLFEELEGKIRDGGLFLEYPSSGEGEGFAPPIVQVELRGPADARRLFSHAKLEAALAAKKLRRSRATARALGRLREAERAVAATAAKVRAIARRADAAKRHLDERTARDVATGPVLDLAARWPQRAVKAWAKQLLRRLGERLHAFVEEEPPADEDREASPERSNGPEERRPLERGDPLAELRANLVVDARTRSVPPVVFEEVPTYANLLGSLEAGDPLGPEHLRIRAGSLLAASGGVLVVEARELLADAPAWKAVKRALLRGKIELQRFDLAQHQPLGPVRPQPVELATKVVLIGDDETHVQLFETDDDFRTLFQVKAEVEDDLPNTAEGRERLATTLARLARRAGLLAPDASGIAALLEHAARLAARRDRLALGLSELLQALREAEGLARDERARRVTRGHVERALVERRARHDRIERKTQELMDDGIVLVDTAGARTACVNALTVYDAGDHVFARPSRVTAAVSLGRAGVIDIERESHLSGELHHKGVQIMAGVLRSRYSQERPLCLTASVCSEQSYAPIDGDSASAAELVAILSALADLPLDQGWAVTGALNQLGEIQAIGGVNEKIEGFHDACRARGLTGKQGVLIPASNKGDLMLREDVVAAVAAGRFQVRAAVTLDDVIATLTGRDPALVHARVDAKLAALAEAWRRHERDESGAGPEGNGTGGAHLAGSHRHG